MTRGASSSETGKSPRARLRKYHAGNLIPMLRLAAKLRNEMCAAGFTDNSGAIHSAERIVNILGLCLKYPTLTHINNLRGHDGAKFSVDALAAYGRGERVLIEHVSPLRDLTRQVIQEIDLGASDEKVASFITDHFELVLLTQEETTRLNRVNRSKMDPGRLSKANIPLAGLQKAVVTDAPLNVGGARVRLAKRTKTKARK